MIRAQIYLDNSLKTIGKHAAQFEVLTENVRRMRTTYACATGKNAAALRDLDVWKRTCTEDTQANYYRNWLAISLINQLDRRLRAALLEDKVTPGMLDAAKQNAMIDPSCIMSVREIDSVGALDFTSQFKVHYGELLIALAKKEEESHGLSASHTEQKYREALIYLMESLAEAEAFETAQKRTQSNDGFYSRIMNRNEDIRNRIERARKLIRYVSDRL